MSEQKRVGIFRAMTGEDLRRQVKQNFEVLGVCEKAKACKTIIIKPNMVSDNPQYIANGSNTSTAIIEAVLSTLREASGDFSIYICESDTGTTVKGRRFDEAARYMGLDGLKEKYDFEILNLSRQPLIDVEIPRSSVIPSIRMPRVLMDADMIINMPKMKTHKYSTVTCSLKNMFGTIPDPLRVRHHYAIHDVVADLNSIFADRMFVVMDAVRCMEAGGPLYGTPVDMGLIVFSDSPLAADATACRLMGVKPDDVKHIRLFNERYGHMREEDIVQYGLDPSALSRPFAPADKNLFTAIEGRLMHEPLVVKIVFNETFQRKVSYPLRHLTRKLRGGSFSWYKEGVRARK